MPGLFIHMAMAEELNKTLKMEEDKIITGSIAADTCLLDEDPKKEKSHFGHKYQKADPKSFAKKYKNELEDPFVIGYLSHLYLDSKFYNKFLAQNYILISGESYTDSNAIFFDKRDNKIKTFYDIYSPDKIYRDYSITNYQLCNDYGLDTEYSIKYIPEIIEEIDYQKLPQINRELERFKPEKLTEKTNCFSYKDLNKFIKESSKDFLNSYIYKKNKVKVKEE